MRSIRLILLVLITFLGGCATTATIEPTAVRMNPGEGQFAPARVFMNRKIPVPRIYADRLEAVEAALKQSEAFFDVGRGVDSPIILDITLERGSRENVVQTAGHLLSAATLFLVPSKVHAYNELKVSVYIHGKRIKSYEFRQDYGQIVGLHNYNEIATNQHNEFRSIRNLVNQFVNALDADDLLPRVRLDESESPDAQPSTPKDREANQRLWSTPPSILQAVSTPLV